MLRKMRKAVSDPSAVRQFLADRRRYHRATLRAKIAAFRHRDLPRHKSMIHDFIDQDEFLLVVLDACRYDYLADVHGEYIDGEIQRVFTPHGATPYYVSGTWTEQYDLTYVAGGPPISDESFVGRANISYRPSDHIDTIVDAWRQGYEKELGVMPPEAVTHAALEHDDDRMVVHYFQPHAPYIGDERLRMDADQSDREQNIIETYERIKNGDIRPQRLREVYRSNLERVLPAVQDLIRRVDRPVVITADHGELLGEKGQFFHGHDCARVPSLCVVPWLEVANSEVGVTDEPLPNDYVRKTDSTERSVEDQLRDLGYA